MLNKLVLWNVIILGYIAVILTIAFVAYFTTH